MLCLNVISLPDFLSINRQLRKHGIQAYRIGQRNGKDDILNLTSHCFSTFQNTLAEEQSWTVSGYNLVTTFSSLDWVSAIPTY